MTATKRDLLIHLAYWFSFFVFITLARQYFDLSYWAFWLGGLFGIILPDIDHLIYVYFVKPQDLSSQRVGYLINKKEIKRGIYLLYETRSERKELIFHSVFFQIIFLVLTFWVMSSSGSLFGRGLVLSFALHLSIDQVIDLTELKSFDNWLKLSPIIFDSNKAKIYVLVVILLVCFFGFLL
jgi:hypothetical protein